MIKKTIKNSLFLQALIYLYHLGWSILVHRETVRDNRGWELKLLTSRLHRSAWCSRG